LAGRVGVGPVAGVTAVLDCEAILVLGPVVFVGERPASPKDSSTTAQGIVWV